jgi:hypothetical protein
VIAVAAGTRAKITAGASGARLGLPALPLATPVTVQLQAANGQCWETVYDAAIVNDVTQFKARATP